MTKEERLEQVLLSLALGPIFPLYGVVDKAGVLKCECGNNDCQNPGKHPRRRGYRTTATHDPEQIGRWFRQYPLGNFGVSTGHSTVAIDADVRPDSNGLLSLEYLEIDNAERLPFTVEVITGRNNGSRHYFFRPPVNVPVSTRAKALPGLDVRAAGGYCVTPGSRHQSGGYYRFAPDCRPDEQNLAELPDFLLDVIAPNTAKPILDGAQTLPGELREIQGSGRSLAAGELPDAVVLGVLRRDRVARFYWDGGRKNRTPSEDDFALACKLAFYSRHNLEQMYRLFMQSGLYRSKFLERRPGGNYATWTLKRAIAYTPQVWIKKERATGAKRGRKLLPETIAILNLRQTRPNLPALAIAHQLGFQPKRVRDAIRYHDRQAENSALLHRQVELDERDQDEIKAA